MLSEQEKQTIKRGKLLIALINPKFVEDKRNYEICRYAASQNKLMYAIIKQDTDYKKFKTFPWRKIYYYTNINDLSDILRKIKKDKNFYEAVCNV